MRLVYRHIFCVFLLLLATHVSFSQQTEEEVRSEANKLFENEQFVEATPLFLRLISLNPKSHEYNFKYGTCLLFNSNIKSEGLRYLNYAIKDENIDPRAYYYRGKALHLDYQFENAKKSYQRYLNSVDRPNPNYDVDLQIRMCDNGKRLLSEFTDIIVAEKKEIDSEDFFRIYRDAETLGGEVVVFQEFQSKVDKKKGHIPVAHFRPDAPAIYYASYGDDDDNGLDIYVRKRLPGGGWGLPQAVPGLINTPQDENFPYLHPSGRFLYFSSKGHNSMGGFDIFMSRYKESNETWMEPENVDFAISSPDDDLFYVVDSMFQNAYFASARQSEDGKYHVYRVKVVRVPVQEVIVMGDFESTVDPNIRMTARLVSSKDNKEVAQTETNDKKKYAIVFPQGGTYKYLVGLSNSTDTREFIVEIPHLEEIRPLKQKMVHTIEDGEEIVKIVNMFDEDVENAEEIIANLIRQKSKLDVNIDNFDMDKINAEATKKEILADLGMGELTPREVSAQLKNLQKIKTQNTQQSDIILANMDRAIVEKSLRLKELEDEQQALEAKAAGISDPIEKHKILSQAREKEWEKRRLAEEMKTLNAMKTEVAGVMKTESVSEEELARIAKEFDDLLAADNDLDAIKGLKDEKEKIELIRNSGADNIVSELLEKRIKLNDGLDDIKTSEASIDQRVRELKSQNQVDRTNAQFAKKKELAALESAIQNREREIEQLEREKLLMQDDKKALNKDIIALDDQIDVIQRAKIATTMPELVSEIDLRDAIEQADSYAISDDVTDYDQEIALIERDHPELSGRNYVDESSEEGKEFGVIRTDVAVQENRINSNSSSSPAEKLEDLISLTENTIADLEKRKTYLENQPGASTSDELNELNKYLATQKENLEGYKSELELLETQSSSADVVWREEDIKDELSPELESDLASIQDSDLSEIEKVNKQLEVYSDYEADIERAIQENEQKMKKDPDNEGLIKRNESLNNLLDDTRTAKEELFSNAIPENTSLYATNELSADQIENDVYPGYVQKMDALNNSSSTQENLIEKIQLTNDLINKLHDKESELIEMLDKNPDDQELRSNLNAIEELMKSRDDDVAQWNQELNNIQPVDADVLAQKEELKNDLVPDFETKRENAGSIDGVMGLQSQISLEEDLIKAAEKELVDVQEQLDENPNDEDLIKEKQLLEEIITEAEAVKSEAEQELNAMIGSTSIPDANVKDEVMRKVDPTYDSDLFTIRQEPGTEQDALNWELDREKETVSALKEYEKDLIKESKKDPENTDLLEELKNTGELLAEHETRATELENRLDQLYDTERNLNSSEALINQISPDYFSEKERINNDNTLTPDRRLTALQKNDIALLKAIDTRLGELEKELESDPNNKNLKKEIEKLNEISQQLQEAIDNRDDEIKKQGYALEVSVSPEQKKLDVLESAHPGYLNKLKKINESGLNREELLELRVDLHKDVLNDLKDAQRSLENFLIDNPGDRDAQTELDILKTIQSDVENELIADQEELKLERSKNDRIASTEDDINRILPDYEERIERIERDGSLTREEQIQQLQDLDLELIRKINEEQDRLTDEAVNSSNPEPIRDQIDQLEELKLTIQQMVKDREVELFQLNSATATVSESDKDQMIQELDPDYENELKQIQETASNENRNELLSARVTDFLSLLNEQKENIERELRVDPSRIDLTKKLNVINALIADTESQLEELKASSTTIPTAISAQESEETLQEVQPDYTSRRDEIRNSGLNSTEEAQQLLDLEKELMGNLISARQTVEDELRRNGDDSQLLRRKEILDQLIEQSQSRIEELEKKVNADVADVNPIDSNPSDTDTLNNNVASTDLESMETAILNELDKKYLENKIQGDLDKAPQNRLDQQYLDNGEMLSTLNSELQRTIKKLEKNPDDPELLARKSSLESLISKLEDEQNRIVQIMATDVETSDRVAGLLNDVDPTYANDIQSIQEEGGQMESNAIAERERILQEKIEEKLKELAEKQKRKFSVFVELDQVRLGQMLDASERREEAARKEATTSPEDLQAKNDLIESIQDNILTQEDRSVLDVVDPDLEELKLQDVALERYERELENTIEALALKIDPDEDDLKQKDWLEEELEKVKKRRYNVSVSIEEMTTMVINDAGDTNNVTPVASVNDDAELARLENEESAIKAQLENEDLSQKEKKQLENDLATIEAKQTDREIEIVNTELDAGVQRSEEINGALEELATNGSPTAKADQQYMSSEMDQIETIRSEAKNADSKEEENYLLNEAKIRQEKLNDDMQESIVTAKKESLEEEHGISLTNEADLEHKQRNFIIEIGEIEQRIEEIDEQLKTAKKKERPALEKEREALVERRESISDQLDRIIAQLRAENDKKVVAVVEEEARNSSITFNEERKIAATPEYENYKEKATVALQLENDIANLESEQKEDQRSLDEKLETENTDSFDIQALIERLKRRNEEIESKRSELEIAKNEADQALPADEEEAMKMKNLAARGIEPIKTAVVVASMVNMPSTSLAINESTESTYSEANPIPLEVKAPKGLVYRVQIGAFRNAIPQDLFKEFNPVSGEEIGNTGITRYMAGYFSNAETVVNAREEIRSLGYGDAYVVAYCDGKRIGFGEAKALEESGTCIPKKESEMMFEVAVNTAESKGIKAAEVLEEVPEYNYAQAPGAVESNPIELTKGLFFTVQVGVFSKPVTKYDVMGMEEIYTVRMPNGQIRYNSGMFDTVEDAKVRKKLANSKGIKAFVTAYFEGERITIEEAEELLAKYGTDILQTNMANNGGTPKTFYPIGTDTVQPNQNYGDSYEGDVFIQIVSKKTFTEFPRDVLNRYNAKGEFYYDEKEGKVKSIVYNNPDRLPWVYKFKDDIDTVYLTPEELISESPTIVVRFENGSVPGDFMDWLLRFNYRREFVKINAGYIVKIYAVESTKQEQVMDKIRTFGLEPETINELQD